MEKKASRSCLNIAIVGPESSGKTTIASQLAQFYKGLLIEEYARSYLENKKQYVQDDLVKIAFGQHKAELNARNSNAQLTITDTNLLVIMVWSLYKYGKINPEIEQLNQRLNYDIIFLTDYDIPWEHDPLRENPNISDRKELFELYKQLLIDKGDNYIVLSGSKSQRLEMAKTHLNNLLKQ